MDILATIEEHIAVCRATASMVDEVERIANRMVRSLREGGKICWMGNGGSAADSQHLAAEFVGRFELERRGLSSIALTTDTSILTAVANDYGFASIFERQVEALCHPADVVVGISTSGNSENVCRALRKARAIGCFTAAFTGISGGEMAAIAETCLSIPSSSTARVQEVHILLGHVLCGEVERQIMAVRTKEAYVL